MKLIKLTFLMFVGLFLVACGGGGGSSGSSSAFAPANAAAFETKFINQLVTFENGDAIEILANQQARLVLSVTIMALYTYTNTGANTATVELPSASVTYNFSFTSSLAGTYTRSVQGTSTNISGTFAFAGSN